MPTSVNHNNNNSYTVILDPPTQTGGNLTTPLLLVPLEFNELADPPQRIISVANYDQAIDLEDDGLISESTLAALQVAFSQPKKPAIVKIANIDLENAETITAALNAIKALDNQWYGLSIWSRVAADIVTAATWIETQQKFFVAQSALATVVGVFPASLEYLLTTERTALIYHTTDAVWAEFGWMVSRLVHDPDIKSQGWRGNVLGITAYTSFTETQKQAGLANNVNIGLAYSVGDFFVHAGTNMQGRAIEEIITRDWFIFRLSERISLLDLKYANQGEKITVSLEGAALIKAEIDAQLLLGVRARHFIRGQTRSNPVLPITPTMRANRTLYFEGAAQLAISAKAFNFTFLFGKDPVITIVE